MAENQNRAEPMVSPKDFVSPKAFRGLFAILGVLSILPYWTVKYPVITDYPNHMARWFVLFHLHDPQFTFGKFFAADWGPFPYVATDALGVWLQYLLPIDIVGRIILTLCVISIPLATYFFLRVANPGQEYLSLWAFLIAFNPNFIMGSLGSELSVALCLIAVALWIQFCARPTTLRALALTALMSILYLTHLIGFAVAGLVMGVYALASRTPLSPAKPALASREDVSADPKPLSHLPTLPLAEVSPNRKPLSHLLTLSLLSLPGIAMFLLSRLHAGTGGVLNYKGLTVWDKARNLVFPLRFFTTPQTVLVLLGLAIVAAIYWKVGEVGWNRTWVIITGALTLTYLIAPGEYGLGGYLDLRIVPCVYLFILAAVQIRRHRSWMMVAAAVFVLCGILRVETLFLSKQKELQGLSAGFASLPRDAKVLQVINSRGIPTLIGRGDIHHIMYGLMQKGLIVPSVFHIAGVQPIRLVGDPYCTNPFCVVVEAESADWKQAAASYDYFWVQPYPAAVAGVSAVADPVFTNEYVTVYKTRRAGLAVEAAK